MLHNNDGHDYDHEDECKHGHRHGDDDDHDDGCGGELLFSLQIETLQYK